MGYVPADPGGPAAHQGVGLHLQKVAFVWLKKNRKPEETRDKIVALMGDVPRVELFARQSLPGWDVWGNEVESTILDFWSHYFGPEQRVEPPHGPPCQP